MMPKGLLEPPKFVAVILGETMMLTELVQSETILFKLLVQLVQSEKILFKLLVRVQLVQSEKK